MKYYFFAFLLLYCNILSAQNQSVIDSLMSVLESNISEKERVDIYVEIADEYGTSDSAKTFQYLNKAIKLADKINYSEGKIDAIYLQGWTNLQTGKYPKAKQFFLQVEQSSKVINYQKGRAKGLSGLGIINNYQGNYEKALEYYNKSLKIRKEIGDKRGMSISYKYIGHLYAQQGNYEKALDYYQKSLELAQELKNKKEISSAYISIGLIYENQGKHEKALKYNFQALELAQEIEDKRIISIAYNNIGSIYDTQDNFEQGLNYNFKALKVYEETGNKKGISIAYNNIGGIYSKKGDYEKALEYYNKSLKIRKNLGNKSRMCSSYANIGNVYIKQAQYEKALEYLFKSLEIAELIDNKKRKSVALIGIGKVYSIKKQWNVAQKYLTEAFELLKAMGIVEDIRDVTEQLALVEKELGNYKAAYEYQVIFKQMADSLKNEEQTQKMTRLEMSYEFKQEKDSIQFANEKERVALEKDIHNREITQFASLIGLALLFVLLFTLFLFFQSKHRSNKLLTEKSEELQLANDEIYKTNEELQILNQRIQTTLNTVEHQRDEILDSVHYAQGIQQAILPELQNIHQSLPESFVFFKPRDVVSGDFYFFAQKEYKVVIASIDCTGHGIPGAFMSLIANDLLHEIINLKSITQPDKILNILKERVIGVLKQESTNNQDGMEISICSIEIYPEEFYQEVGIPHLEYAGTGNPLVYFQENEMFLIKPDKIIIGGFGNYSAEQKFTLHRIPLNKPTTFYLFSDGYQDQFGGIKGKKFMIRRFRELLFNIHQKSMEEQKSILDKTIANWMGKEKQIDDILVMGVRV